MIHTPSDGAYSLLYRTPSKNATISSGLFFEIGDFTKKIKIISSIVFYNNKVDRKGGTHVGIS